MPPPNTQALAAYRHLLRATRVAFRGDTTTLLSARSRARADFQTSSALAVDSEEAAKQIQHAEEVALVLRRNVVQGENRGDEGRWRLNIHAETEKGDNESIKLAGKGTLGGGESAAAAGCGCGSV